MVILHAKKRDKGGKSFARSLRSSGLIPAVVYGKNLLSQPLIVDKKEFLEVLKQQYQKGLLIHLIVQNSGGNEVSYPVIVKEIQRHFLHWTIQHIDFQVVSPDQVIKAEVPIVLGEQWETAFAGGGRLGKTSVRIEGPVHRLPGAIFLDVSKVPEGGRLLMKDLPLPPDVRLVSPEDEVVFFR
ncbi:MAG: 50S ribosomal protein L25 [bacterium JZ-2024 1]